ncbi:hypothetical protein D3Z53_11280 [Lachnospiraceae bacterium]|jgi:hypothetical protein|nr:hypothetical protein [Lachnospiraceae bacterium]
MVSAHYKQTETMDSLKNCTEGLPLAAFPRVVVFRAADRRHICCSESTKKYDKYSHTFPILYDRNKTVKSRCMQYSVRQKQPACSHAEKGTQIKHDTSRASPFSFNCFLSLQND